MFADVPQVLLAHSRRRAEVNEEDDAKGCPTNVTSLRDARLFKDVEEVQVFVTTLQKHCVKLFIDNSLRKSHTWRIDGHDTVLDLNDEHRHAHCMEPPFIRFTLSREENGDLRNDPVKPRAAGQEVVVDVAWRDGQSKATCSCHLMATKGMPCQHITAVCTLFRNYSHRKDDIQALCFTDYIPILPLFDNYWYRNSELWLARVPEEATRRATLSGDRKEFGYDETGRFNQELVKQQEKNAAYQDMTNLAALVHNKAMVIPGGSRQFMPMLQEIGECYDDNKIPQVMKRTLPIEQLGMVQNPNRGRAKKWGSFARKRGKTENKGLKKKGIAKRRQRRLN